MGDVFGEYSWATRTYECGPDGVATMASVCNWLQEAASLNAETLAFSKSNFEAAGENISWVLTRLKVRMERFPKWGETVSILTFPRGGRRIVAYRDFVLSGADGGEIGRATSEWMLIDLASRKVVAIPEGVFAAANTVRAPVFGDEPFAKLRWDCREASPDALAFGARRIRRDGAWRVRPPRVRPRRPRPRHREDKFQPALSRPSMGRDVFRAAIFAAKD